MGEWYVGGGKHGAYSGHYTWVQEGDKRDVNLMLSLALNLLTQKV